jgi:hypothetical protein
MACIGDTSSGDLFRVESTALHVDIDGSCYIDVDRRITELALPGFTFQVRRADDGFHVVLDGPGTFKPRTWDIAGSPNLVPVASVTDTYVPREELNEELKIDDTARLEAEEILKRLLEGAKGRGPGTSQ